jgi:hypothetical protein
MMGRDDDHITRAQVETDGPPTIAGVTRRMRNSLLILAYGVSSLAAVFAEAPRTLQPAPTALTISADNPHYFLWRGRPTVLIGSGEHYGALINLDFDYRKYFDTLAADGMGVTRVFSGAYVEPEGAFNIARNTLAPSPGRFIAPWVRSDQPGYANGGNKFDVRRWDEAYFARLKTMAAYAANKGVVIEFTLFCPMYEDKQWSLSPMNARNNINGVGEIGRLDAFTLDKHGGLLEIQDALTRQVVTELNPMDNVIFEIMNEPYTRAVPLDWQRHIAAIVVETERGLPKKHLISQNIANKSGAVTAAHAAVSVFNFHYATAEAVSANYGLNKVIGDNETGFKGTSDTPYRQEAWEFILAGGGLFNHLDYSFAAGFEDGTFSYPATQPGGGNSPFRRQLRVLRDFIHRFDLVRLRPDASIFAEGMPAGVTARALVDPGRAMAIFLRGSGAPTVLRLDLPAGTWAAEWVETKTGTVARTTTVTGGEVRSVDVPSYEMDIALRLVRQ